MVELDQREDGGAIQAALADMTGRRTVPNGEQRRRVCVCVSQPLGAVVDLTVGRRSIEPRRNPSHNQPNQPTPDHAVFFNGKTIGGGDDTVALARSGQLRQMLSGLGALKK